MTGGEGDEEGEELTRGEEEGVGGGGSSMHMSSQRTWKRQLTAMSDGVTWRECSTFSPSVCLLVRASGHPHSKREQFKREKGTAGRGFDVKHIDKEGWAEK